MSFFSLENYNNALESLMDLITKSSLVQNSDSYNIANPNTPGSYPELRDLMMKNKNESDFPLPAQSHREFKNMPFDNNTHYLLRDLMMRGL